MFNGKPTRCKNCNRFITKPKNMFTDDIYGEKDDKIICHVCKIMSLNN